MIVGFRTRLILVVITAVCVFICMTESSAEAAQASLNSSIRATRLSTERIALQFCDLGTCETFGDPNGYTLAEWSTLSYDCRWLGMFGKPLVAAAGIIVSGIAITFAPSFPIVAVIGMMLGQNLELARGVNAADMVAANQMTPGLLHESDEVEFVLGFEQFSSLKRGLDYCTGRFEKKRKYRFIDVLS